MWNRNPIKIEFIKQNRTRIPGIKENTTRWGGECALCNQIFPQAQLEVDHLSGNVSLASVSDIEGFVMHLARPTHLQFVCKGCHKIKSYAERYSLSFEEARIKKQAIAQKKTKKKT